MPASLPDLLARLRHDHRQLGLTLYPPATEAEVLAFEQTKGVRLPADLRAFYRCCNGFESEEDLFRLIPLGEILENGPDSYLANPCDFHLAEYLIYSDMWTLTIHPLDPEQYGIYHKEEKVITLTDSFAEFVETFLAHGVYGDGGLCDWPQLVRQRELACLLALPTTYSSMEELNQLAESTRQKLGLQYDAAGVKFVEGFIERNKVAFAPEEWPGLINSLGAFLGCCIIRNYGGSWQADDEGGVGVAFDEKNQVFPFSKTRKQFENGLEDSVYSFYTVIPVVFNRPGAAAAPPPAPPRKPWYKFW